MAWIRLSPCGSLGFHLSPLLIVCIMARPQAPSSPRETQLSRVALAAPAHVLRTPSPARDDTLVPRTRAEVSSATVFLVLLVLGDLAFIFIHVMRLTVPAVESGMYALDYDRGHAEFYQYIKMLWIIALFAALLVHTRTGGFAAWGLLFAYLLLDDALAIHETAGASVAQALPFAEQAGLRAQDFGELAVSAAAGAVLLTLLAWAYARGHAAFRRASLHVVLLLAALAFFGVGVDMLQSLFRFDDILAPLLGIIEDGGEMIVMSLAVWYVFLLHRGNGNLSSPLQDALATAARQARSLVRP